MADDPNADRARARQLRRPGHHRPRGPRGGAEAARHVHRVDRRRAACTTWSTRSSTTRSTRRWPAHCDRVDVTIHPDNSVTVVDNGRGIPVAMMEKEGKPARRGRADRPARRRQVRRRRRLQGLRRPARRRRLRRQRAVGAAARRGPPRRLRRGRQDYVRGAPQGPLVRASRRRRPARRSPSCPTPRSSRRSTSSSRRSSSACARPRSSRAACASRSTDERAEGHKAEFHYEGGIQDFVAYLNENKDPVQRQGHLLRGGERARAPSRSRCSGTPPTRSRSSPSPTTSTRTRAARTCRASARR